jgi:hypothetical protein
MTPAEFGRVWEEWDAAPGRDGPARAMADACDEIAASLGMSSAAFRDLLMVGRRAGLTRPEALRLTRMAAQMLRER